MKCNIYSLLAILALIQLNRHTLAKQANTCGGDCFFSEDCALDSEDESCRCSYFHCRTINPGHCGGGCIIDSQCSRWAGGDLNCICGTLFECVNRSQAETPRYQAFANFMLSAKGSAYQKKMTEMKRLYATKEYEGHI